MNIAEMKLKAINYLINLKKEESIGEILQQLEKLDEQENRIFKLAQHYPAIKAQYGAVLERLAK